MNANAPSASLRGASNGVGTGTGVRMHGTLAGVFALVLVGLTLRAPITSLAAVVPQMQDDLGISTGQAGLLTTIPILMFAAISPLVGVAAQRWGVNRVLVGATVLLAIAVVVRPWSGYGLIVATTLCVGAFITAGNVLLPAVVRRDFAHRQGIVMGFSSASITGGATLAAAGTGLLVLWWDWRLALSLWGLLVALAALTFWWANRQRPVPASDIRVALATPPSSGRASAWNVPTAWGFGTYFALQSAMFYGSTAWLPTMLPAIADVDTSTGTQLASLFQLLGIAGALTAPMLVSRLRSWRLLAFCFSGMYVVMMAGLLWGPSLAVVWLVIGGVGQGATYAMLMALIAARAADVDAVRALSATAQTIGYLGAAAFPFLLGVFAAAGEWGPSLVVLLGLSLGGLALTPLVGSPSVIQVDTPRQRSHREPAGHG